MSGDRELLEMAAKAAGIKYDSDAQLMKVPTGWHTWNPLFNDGDALRLAVALNLDIMQSPASATERVVEVIANEPEDGDCKPWAWEPHGTDQLAATRRAIVRAAAEIGRSL